MHGSNNKLIKLGIVCDQSHSFAISFRHQKTRWSTNLWAQNTEQLRQKLYVWQSHLLAASWKRRGIGLGDYTRYGMLFGLRKIFILFAHIGLLATAGKEAGMTCKRCRSCHPMRAQWFSSGETKTVVTVEC